RTREMYSLFQILPFRNLYYYRIILNNFFTNKYRLPRLYATNTRPINHSRYLVPRFNTRHGSSTRNCTVPLIFNKLPDYIINIVSYNCLKSTLKTFLLTSYINSEQL